MAKQAHKGHTAGIVTAIVGLSLVLQALFVPLHLASRDHVLPDGFGGHLHSHGALEHGDEGHRHASGQPDREQEDSEHESHPATDHLAPLVEPTGQVPLLVHLALAPEVLLADVLEQHPQGRAQRPTGRPRPPPPRRSASPRAPPIVL